MTRFLITCLATACLSFSVALAAHKHVKPHHAAAAHAPAKAAAAAPPVAAPGAPGPPGDVLPSGVAVPAPPAVEARAYIVIDFRTDKIIAAYNANEREEPASLTKLMTSYIVFQELKAGKLKLDENVMVSEHAWRSEGSRTFIELGKPVTVQDLILGMIVQSGNDATIALAERIAGSEQVFAQLMNSNAQKLHMDGSHFENSSGLPSPNHYTTARDMSLLASALIREFPEYYKWFSVHEFIHNGIKQQNRNGLLEKDPTVDGLKTGHTDSAGFCLVSSSQRDGMRVISVVMGSGSFSGRENASSALLNYGFSFYETRLAVKGGTALANTHVWKAERPTADLGIQKDIYLTLPRGAPAPTVTTEVQKKIIAPLTLDSEVGSIKVSAGDKVLATAPLHPLQPDARGGWWRRLIDTIRLWFA
jgi:D-alanyl-D-alanine carboxypeptidase (penicillin-binding protein 5/6)